MVSADLSGIEKAPGHPVRLLMIVRMCLFPDVDVCIQLPSLWQFFQKASLVYLSFVGDMTEP